MSKRSNIYVGLSCADLDDPVFLTAISSPLGMYLKLLSWVWRSPNPPESRYAPPLHEFYSNGLLASWSFDRTLAGLFGVGHRTITRWRSWLVRRGLVITVRKQAGHTLTYLMGTWNQTNPESHWQPAYLWEPGITAMAVEKLIHMGHVTSDITLRGHVKRDMRGHVKSDIQEDISIEELSIEELSMNACMPDLHKELIALGISTNVIDQILNDHQPGYIQEKLNYTRHKQTTAGPDFKPAGYLVAALKDDYNPPRGFDPEDWETDTERQARYLGIGTDFEGLIQH